MANDQYALDFGRVPPADDALLAKLGEQLLDKGSCNVETVGEVVRCYAYAWRYWLGSHAAQPEGWVALEPSSRFSASTICAYANLLKDRMPSRGTQKALKLLRTVAAHICPDVDLTCFDGGLSLLTKAADEPRLPKMSRFSIKWNDLPQEDSNRLEQIRETGAVSTRATPETTSACRVEAIHESSRNILRSEYLAFAGFIRREAPQCLDLPAAARFTPDLVRAYGCELSARLSTESAVATLQKVKFALRRLWPELDFEWVGEIISDLSPKPEAIGISALSKVTIPADEKSLIDRALNLERMSDRIAVGKARRGGPAQVGRRAATIEERQYAIQWFYNSAAADDPHWLTTPCNKKLTKRAVEAYVRALRQTCRDRTIAGELDRVRLTFERIFAIEHGRAAAGVSRRDELDWLLEKARDLRRGDPIGRPAMPPVLTEELVKSAEADLARLKKSIEINRSSKVPWRSLSSLALNYRNSLTQLVEALLVLRAKNLAKQKRPDNLKRGSARYHVFLSEADTKTKQAIYRVVPARCTEYLDFFFDVVVSVIDPRTDGSTVWPSKHGGTLTQSGQQKSIPATTERLVGHAMSAQFFRIAAATDAVRRKNTHPGLARKSLSHRHAARTERSYEATDDVTASNRLAIDVDAVLKDRAGGGNSGRRPPET
jgi:hypothetical protein